MRAECNKTARVLIRRRLKYVIQLVSFRLLVEGRNSGVLLEADSTMCSALCQRSFRAGVAVLQADVDNATQAFVDRVLASKHLLEGWMMTRNWSLESNI